MDFSVGWWYYIASSRRFELGDLRFQPLAVVSTDGVVLHVLLRRSRAILAAQQAARDIFENFDQLRRSLRLPDFSNITELLADGIEQAQVGLRALAQHSLQLPRKLLAPIVLIQSFQDLMSVAVGTIRLHVLLPSLSFDNRWHYGQII